MTSRREVSIVIPTLNGGRDLADLLAAIRDQAGPWKPAVVAIDSGSTDGTLELLRSTGARVLQTTMAEFNHGETRNVALRTVDTEFAVLTVQDALPASRDWLAALVGPLERDGTLAGTCARQRPRPGASRITAHYLACWAAAEPDARVTDPITSAGFVRMSPHDRHRACVFDNVCACIRTAVWRTTPFRRTRIAEDLEWASEVLQAGHRLAYVPDAVVWHSHDRPVSYELRRTYVVHQRLAKLFGLTTVPDAPALLRAIAATLPLHLRLAATEPKARLPALLRGTGLAVALPLGQYLGAKSARDGRELLTVRGV